MNMNERRWICRGNLPIEVMLKRSMSDNLFTGYCGDYISVGCPPSKYPPPDTYETKKEAIVEAIKRLSKKNSQHEIIKNKVELDVMDPFVRKWIKDHMVESNLQYTQDIKDVKSLTGQLEVIYKEEAAAAKAEEEKLFKNSLFPCTLFPNTSYASTLTNQETKDYKTPIKWPESITKSSEPTSRIQKYIEYEKKAYTLEKDIRNISYTLKNKFLSSSFVDIYNVVKDCAVYGDCFIVIGEKENNPLKDIVTLTPKTMYRIEDGSGKVVEYQQGSSPEFLYQGVLQTTKSYKPEEIVHIRIPPISVYGTSHLEHVNVPLDEFFQGVVQAGLHEVYIKKIKPAF